jgi:phosphate uptake regulator
MSMARRKLVKQGSATYTVSLPKEWIERFNLKSGEEIDIEEVGMQLILSSIQKQKKYETIKYNFEKIPKDLVHEFIVSLYKSGIKDTQIDKIDSDKFKLAKEVIDNTIGFEILGSEKDKIHISDLGTSDEESLNRAEQQIYWRLLHMIDRVLDKTSKEKEIHDIDLEINKLSFFIQRNLAAKYSSSSRNFLFYEKISALESIGDFLRSFKIYSQMNSSEIEYMKKMYEIMDLLRANKNDLEYFIDLRKKMNNLLGMTEKLKKSGKGNSALAAILLYKNIKQLFDVSFTLELDKFMQK